MKVYDVIDEEYNKRVKEAEATNLIAEKPECNYVSQRVATKLYEVAKLLASESDQEYFDEDLVESLHRELLESTISLCFIQKEERPIDVCPYCGSKMVLSNCLISTYVAYECKNCGAQSPGLNLKLYLLDEAKTKEAIKDYCESRKIRKEDEK